MTRELSEVMRGLDPDGVTFDELVAAAQLSDIPREQLARGWKGLADRGEAERADGPGRIRYRAPRQRASRP